jgi:hypothetical protein
MQNLLPEWILSQFVKGVLKEDFIKTIPEFSFGSFLVQ